MNQPPEPLDSDVSREHGLHPYHVVYLVKRPAYEFIFAVPETPPPFSGGREAFFQLRFRAQLNRLGIVLKLDELQDFYDSLSCLMEYIQHERRRDQSQL
jgi:hypothetical protein